MNAVIQAEPQLPAPVARRGISEAQWRTLKESLYPGAKSESVMMVWDYCRARSLDPLKKPCHIVPMQVGDQWRDVVMPGIYEYRTTANRTGEYMGHSKPVFGPTIDYMGVAVPEWCELTVYRWNDKAKQRCEYPARAKFSECAGTKWDKQKGEWKLNARWTKAPEQMIEKCAEAAALRKAFPDELGGEHTAEEMEGQASLQTEVTDITPGRVDPRGDVSGVDWELRDKHVGAITDIISEYGSDEAVCAAKFREYLEAHKMNEFQELWITVHDKLAADGIISKATMKKYQKAPAENQRPEGRP